MEVCLAGQGFSLFCNVRSRVARQEADVFSNRFPVLRDIDDIAGRLMFQLCFGYSVWPIVWPRLTRESFTRARVFQLESLRPANKDTRGWRGCCRAHRYRASSLQGGPIGVAGTPSRGIIAEVIGGQMGWAMIQAREGSTRARVDVSIIGCLEEVTWCIRKRDSLFTRLWMVGGFRGMSDEPMCGDSHTLTRA